MNKVVNAGSTAEFVEKIHEFQENDVKNKRNQGNGDAAFTLPSHRKREG